LLQCARGDEPGDNGTDDGDLQLSHGCDVAPLRLGGHGP